MIPFQEILKNSKELPPEVIEKDYCITWLLEGLSYSSPQKDWVFYGGTAIKKIYSPLFRFSEDLDFITEKALSPHKLFSNLQLIYNHLLDKVNIRFYTKTETSITQKDRFQVFIGYDGFPEITMSKQIKLDLSTNQPPLETPKPRQILSTYSDRKEIRGKIKTCSLEALAAEKISTVFDTTRKEPRDLYDLNFLMKTKKLNYRQILKLLHRKYGFTPPLPSLISNIQSDIYQERWEIRLRNQVPKLGSIKPVIESLLKELNNLYGSIRPK